MAKNHKPKEQAESYEPNVDYSALIGQAETEKNYDAAALYEQQRNEKIAAENLPYTQTNTYTDYAEAKQQAEAYYEQYMNRAPFSYDAENDPLYRQYRELYAGQGELAMRDAMGQAAALTGGYGNSYAQSVGQQAYGSYLDKLNGVIPELYEAAYSRYNDAGESLYGKYQAANERKEAELSALEERSDNAYQTAVKLINGGIMPDLQLLNRAGIPWETALNLWQVANGKPYGE